MRILIIAAAFVGVAALARWADAAEKAREVRPMACLNYSFAQDKAGARIAVCLDGKRPKVLTHFAEAKVEGGSVLVGWP